MLKRRQKAEGRRQKHPDAECGRRNGETTDYADGHGWRDGEVEIKFLTVRSLIRPWAVTACDFHDARLERWRGGIDRAAIKSKQRLDRKRQRRASPANRFWVARATGGCGGGSGSGPRRGNLRCWGVGASSSPVYKSR